MKILFIMPYFYPYFGGIETVIDKLSDKLLALGIAQEVSILTTFSSYKFGIYPNLHEHEIDKGRDIYRLNFIPKDICGIYHSYNAGFFSNKLKPILTTISPDIIHFCKTEWFIPNLYIYYLTKKKSKHIFFSSYHPKQLHIKHFPMVIVNKYLFNQMGSIHVPSKIIADAIIKDFKTPSKKINVVSLGTNVCNIDRLQKTECGNDQKKFVRLLNIGRIGKNKGQYKLVEEISLLPTEITNNFEVIFIGKDDGDEKKIQRVISQKKLNNIHIINSVNEEQLEEIYLSSDIYISPSYFEGFGLTIIDAMSYQLPVISFRQGGVQEIALYGSILIEPYNWPDLINAMLFLINNRESRIQLGLQGYNFVKKQYSWEKMAVRISQLYYSLYS